MGFPLGSVVKNSPANARDMGLTPKSGRSPGIGNGNPLQYSCLQNSQDRGAWQATVHRVAKRHTGHAHTHTHTHTHIHTHTHRNLIAMNL